MDEQNDIHTPPTPPHLFSVIEAVRSAFLFVSTEWRYLARLSVPVISLQLGLGMILFMIDKEASSFARFLWGMPAAVFMGWFTFSLVRLIVFGERLHTLPVKDVRFMQYRAGLMKATILLSILFKAGTTVVAEILTQIATLNPEEAMPPPFVIAGLAFTLFLLWSIRFISLPILAAVDYPFLTFLRQAKGFLFSFRILGLMIMCAFPAFLLHSAFVIMIVQDPNQITDAELMLMLAVQVPFAVIISACISAGITFALKEMLGQNAKI